jgi:hypothetical protein
MEPYQQRVVDEKAQNDDRLEKLGAFIDGKGNTSVFGELPEDEQERLVRQRSCMAELSGILGERIAAFPSA